MNTESKNNSAFAAEIKDERYLRNRDLILRAQSGDESAAETLIVENTALVKSLALKFRDRGTEFEDLMQIGTIGMLKAISSFQIERGTAFSTYAVPLIFGEIRRFLRDDGMIKVSREEKRLSAIVCAERERRQAEGESTAISDIAVALGISAAEAASALTAGAPIRSLDESAYVDDDSVTLGNTIFDEDEEQRNFDRLSLGMAIEKLDEWQRKLIVLRYFRDYSQTEVAKLLGVTQVKVSREEKKILGKLREMMG